MGSYDSNPADASRTWDSSRAAGGARPGTADAEANAWTAWREDAPARRASVGEDEWTALCGERTVNGANAVIGRNDIFDRSVEVVKRRSARRRRSAGLCECGASAAASSAGGAARFEQRRCWRRR